jgi:photosystem II stability/assembly factor-like uncharacterized protein
VTRSRRRRGRFLSSSGAVVLALTAVVTMAGCGAQWTTALAGITPGPPLPARAGAHVFVVGLPDVVLASADGGATWTVAHRGEITSDSLGDLWDVAFGDAQHGWAVERGSENRPAMILTTSDGGATWNWQHPGPRGRLLAASASGARHAWAVGYRGTMPLLLATSDGGTTWKEQAVPRHVQALYDVAFSDVRHGWALGADRDQTTCFVLSTADGGAHWGVSYRANTARLSRLASNGARRCWVVGCTDGPGKQRPGLVVATSDGGAHWHAQRSVTSEPLSDIAFPDAHHGWAVGPSGTIVATGDGGTTWVAQHTDRQFDLKAVAFSDATHGWAVLGNSALLATTDGGKTWKVVKPARTEHYLAAITCLGPNKDT